MESFPNPFNARVLLPYEVTTGGQVALRVYNAAGQRVRELYHGYRPPGRYRAMWDGCDDRGAELASGVYLWELRVGGAAVRRTLTLIR